MKYEKLTMRVMIWKFEECPNIVIDGEEEKQLGLYDM